MTVETSNNATVAPAISSDKELNFRKLEAKYENELARERAARADERAAREAAEREFHRLQQERTGNSDADDEHDGEPYVDHRKLNKKLQKFEEKTIKDTDSKIQEGIQRALKKERENAWLGQNPDFYEVLNTHAETFHKKAPNLAESILRMPEGFERQQLVYNNIKALGLDKPEPKPSSIQDKIDANRRNPYYQPSGIGTPAYQSASDFSDSGKEQAYKKMKELQARIRI